MHTPVRLAVTFALAATAVVSTARVACADPWQWSSGAQAPPATTFRSPETKAGRYAPPPHTRPPSWESDHYGTDAAGHAPHVDPVLAADADGNLVVKSNPHRPYAMSAQAKKWEQHQEDFTPAKAVTLARTNQFNRTVAALDGKKKGEYGTAEIALGKAAVTASAGVGLSTDGLQAHVGGTAEAKLIEVSAASNVFGVGDPNGMNNAIGQVKGKAFVGAEAKGDLTVTAGRKGLAIQTGGDAFVGGKAQVTGSGTITLCGLAMNATGDAQASYGIGVTAKGAFVVDWSTMTVRYGAHAALTVGGGLGAGGTVEVSLEKILKDPRTAANCLAAHLKPLGDAAKKFGSLVVEVQKTDLKLESQALRRAADEIESLTRRAAAREIASWAGFFRHAADASAATADTLSHLGSQIERDADTVPTAPAHSTTRPTAQHAGAGFPH